MVEVIIHPAHHTKWTQSLWEKAFYISWTDWASFQRRLTQTPQLYIPAAHVRGGSTDGASKKSICNLNGNVMSPWWQWISPLIDWSRQGQIGKQTYPLTSCSTSSLCSLLWRRIAEGGVAVCARVSMQERGTNSSVKMYTVNINVRTPHCGCPTLLITQTVGPSKAPFRGNGGSRGGGGRDEVST